jgi:hypothetical protein
MTKVLCFYLNESFEQYVFTNYKFKIFGRLDLLKKLKKLSFFQCDDELSFKKLRWTKHKPVYKSGKK